MLDLTGTKHADNELVIAEYVLVSQDQSIVRVSWYVVNHNGIPKEID